MTEQEKFARENIGKEVEIVESGSYRYPKAMVVGYRKERHWVIVSLTDYQIELDYPVWKTLFPDDDVLLIDSPLNVCFYYAFIKDLIPVNR